MRVIRVSNRTSRRQRRSGLILLIVLGMLAMFSLLAVTYVISSGSSIVGSQAMRTRTRNDGFSLKNLRASDKVVAQLIRGTNNQESPFYMNSLLGDVFGPDCIRSNFGPYLNNNTVVRIATTRVSDPVQNVNLVKVTLNRDAELNGPLSDFENEYNSRVMTVLEGPLYGQSFRVLKYVGYVKNGNTLDPNTVVQPVFDPQVWTDPTRIYPPWILRWQEQGYNDPDAASIQYSVLIDLNEAIGKRITGEVIAADGTFRSATRSLADWIAEFGIETLFFAKRDLAAPSVANMTGYKFIMNDAAFNHPGIGLEDVAALPGSGGFSPIVGFGNLDSRRLLATTRTSVSPAVLTHYDYLNDERLMAVNPFNGLRGVDSVGSKRTDNREFRLNGASNEGFDVADWRDAWLSHSTNANGIPLVTPSFHRPEVINHIAHLFGTPSSMTPAHVEELLRLINASTGRVMNVRFGTINWNTRFQTGTGSFPIFNSTWSSPPSAAEITQLQQYVRWQINGINASVSSANPAMPVWDVDNDNDTVREGVWIDPGLEIVYSPEGRRLRPLVSVTVEDLDSRVNLNTSGDRSHSLAGFDAGPHPFSRRGLANSQGFGYGPADISLVPLFTSRNPSTGTEELSPFLRSRPSAFSFFDELNGARRFIGQRLPSIPYNDPRLDRVPGRARRGGAIGFENDPISQVSEREQHVAFTGYGGLGLPLGRRGSTALDFDVYGNPVVQNVIPLDGDPNITNAGTPNAPGVLSETNDDSYDRNAMSQPNMDDPLGLEDLEAVLRRFDSDSQLLAPRLREYLGNRFNYDSLASINREVTTRSGELRYPVIAAAMKTIKNYGVGDVVSIESGAPSYIRYVQMLHSQRYRQRAYPAALTDDPELNYAAISELFPVEFGRGLRMDLNRPFGNGYDNDGDGDIDDPQELATFQNEAHPVPDSSTVDGNTPVTLRASFPIFDATQTPPSTPALNLPQQAANEESLYGTGLKSSQRVVGNASVLPSVLRRSLAGRQILARNLYCLAQLIVPRSYELPGMASVPATSTFLRAKIRARALAQWAVNVVDYRDTDAAMTRFEYDILPFGTGTAIASPGTARPPYWAPDHVRESVNGVPNTTYVDVVWGVEMPELVLTETFAYHNKNLKNTDMDNNSDSQTNQLSVPGDASSDVDLDQYRFPDAGLLMELYATRSGGTSDRAGVSRRMYNYNNVDNVFELNLAALAPSSTTWGQQPVWRIAISEAYTGANASEHPQARLEAGTLDTVTLQHSIENISAATGAGLSRDGDPTNAVNVEQLIGNDLLYSHLGATPVGPNPVGFDRFVFFTSSASHIVGTATLPDVPDILPANGSAADLPHCVYQPTGDITLPGNTYLVVGPKSTVTFGSRTHNQYTGHLDTGNITRNDMATNPTHRPQLTPSFQRIGLTVSGATLWNLHNEEFNSIWTPSTRQSRAYVFRTAAPSPEWITDGTTAPQNRRIFYDGVPLNISYPKPVAGSTIWTAANLPTVSLNSNDRIGGPQPRPDLPDNTPGFGDTDSNPPDSWVDLSNPGANAFPDVPIDRSNPLINGQGRYRSGTYENVRAAYLQRLADPDVEYDPVYNPYITVDWMSIDLTVFNGETNQDLDTRDAMNQMAAPGSYNPSNPNPVVFQSRYKTGRPNGGASAGVSYLSPNSVQEPTDPAGAAVPFVVQTTPIPNLPAIVTGIPVQCEAFFSYSFGQERNVADWSTPGLSSTTFGYLNIGNAIIPGATPSDPEPNNAQVQANPPPTFDAFGRPQGTPANALRGYGFNMANVMWLNRPFATPYEMMMVPNCSADQLGLRYGIYSDRSGTLSNRNAVPYLHSFQRSNASATDLPLPVAGSAQVSSVSQQWMNLDSFWGIPRDGGAGWFEDWPLLLEFVETQPPFADANQFWRPDVMRGLANQNRLAARFLNSFIPQGYYSPNPMNNNATSEAQSTRGPGFLAPFNFKPSYVAAGKVNLNTVAFDNQNRSHVLKALEHLYISGERSSEFGTLSNQIASDFLNNRRGYPVGVANNFFGTSINSEMHPEFPTRFAGAYRPALSSNLSVGSPGSPDATAKDRQRFSVETGLLRSSSTIISPAGSPPTNDPMLMRRPVPTPDHVNNTQPFDYLQRVMRLPNVTTNQSNVFAVWVTVGLFEYDPINGFGEEYVTETGGIQRERKFYIIDRTVPVGFKQGEDLNTRRTILLERTIP